MSNIQASDFMYLHRILQTKLVEFRLSDWISVALGRKVEIGTCSRSTRVN